MEVYAVNEDGDGLVDITFAIDGETCLLISITREEARKLLDKLMPIV